MYRLGEKYFLSLRGSMLLCAHVDHCARKNENNTRNEHR